eukprot:TRINITY_DN19472_c0_g1_i1.p2 TRINITY_DN19472_c0_g1~~TRINITY_DN19472_c0_g1_i1.p2  ORF type:complete len:120 (+),score=16.29 TRINITY_DN19472_c0_g1_i1:58-417(+)
MCISDRQYKELLVYDIEKNCWEVQTEDEAPNGRNSHGFIYVQEQQSVYLFGGADQNGPLNDLYKLDLSKNDFSNWQKIITKGDGPEGIEMHSLHYYKGTLLVVGGRTLNEVTNLSLIHI